MLSKAEILGALAGLGLRAGTLAVSCPSRSKSAVSGQPAGFGRLFTCLLAVGSVGKAGGRLSAAASGRWPLNREEWLAKLVNPRAVQNRFCSQCV